jgi:hypothetical protein
MCNIRIPRIGNSPPFFNEIQPYPTLGESRGNGELARVLNPFQVVRGQKGRLSASCGTEPEQAMPRFLLFSDASSPQRTCHIKCGAQAQTDNRRSGSRSVWQSRLDHRLPRHGRHHVRSKHPLLGCPQFDKTCSPLTPTAPGKERPEHKAPAPQRQRFKSSFASLPTAARE